MKKILVLVMLVFTLAGFGQIAEKLTWDAGAELAMPLGDFGDSAGMGFGLTGKVYYPYKENIDFTGRTGFVYFSTHDDFDDYGDANWMEIPIMFGTRYKMPNKFYGLFELGFTLISFSYEYEYTDFWGNTQTHKYDYDETELAFSIGGGYIHDKFDFSGFINSVQTDGDSANHFGIRVGYKFM
jgi:hypothetical protein